MSPDHLTLLAVLGAAVCVGVAIASARLTWRQRAGLIAGAATLLGGLWALLRGERRDAPELPPPPPPAPPLGSESGDDGADGHVKRPNPSYLEVHREDDDPAPRPDRDAVDAHLLDIHRRRTGGGSSDP
jgi:hypothetical protein